MYTLSIQNEASSQTQRPLTAGMAEIFKGTWNPARGIYPKSHPNPSHRNMESFCQLTVPYGKENTQNF